MDCIAPLPAETCVTSAPAQAVHVPTASRLLSFGAGGSDYVIDIRCAREIRTPEPTAPLPGCSDAMNGVIDLRGTAVPVIDVARLLHTAASPGASAAVVVGVGDGLIGLQVDAIDDAIEIEPHALRPVPPLAHTPLMAHLVGLATVGGRLLLWLDVQSLLRSASAPQVNPTPETASFASSVQAHPTGKTSAQQPTSHTT